MSRLTKKAKCVQCEKRFVNRKSRNQHQRDKTNKVNVLTCEKR